MSDYERKLLRIVCGLLAGGDYTSRDEHDKPFLIWDGPEREYPVLRDAMLLLDEFESNVRSNEEIEAQILLDEREKEREKAALRRKELEKLAK